MSAGNTRQPLNLEIVTRDKGGVFGIERDVVAVDGLIGKLGVEVVGVSERTGGVQAVNSYGACAAEVEH